MRAEDPRRDVLVLLLRWCYAMVLQLMLKSQITVNWTLSPMRGDIQLISHQQPPLNPPLSLSPLKSCQTMSQTVCLALQVGHKLQLQV